MLVKLWLGLTIQFLYTTTYNRDTMQSNETRWEATGKIPWFQVKLILVWLNIVYHHQYYFLIICRSHKKTQTLDCLRPSKDNWYWAKNYLSCYFIFWKGIGLIKFWPSTHVGIRSSMTSQILKYFFYKLQIYCSSIWNAPTVGVGALLS